MKSAKPEIEMRLGNDIPYKEVSGEVGHAPMRALQLNRHLTALALINMVHNAKIPECPVLDLGIARVSCCSRMVFSNR